MTIIKGKSRSDLQSLFWVLTCISITWISLQKIPMRDQDTLSALTAGLSGGICQCFWSVYFYHNISYTAWGFFRRKRFAPVNLQYPTDERSEGGRGALGQFPALSERWANRSHVCTCTHTDTHTWVTWQLIGVWGKTCKCTGPILKASCACMCFWVVSFCRCNLCCVSLSVSACLCRMTEARNGPKMIKRKPEMCRVEEESPCLITESGMKQSCSASLYWKQVLCPLLHIKKTWPSSWDMCSE